MENLILSFGVEFKELYSTEGLKKVHNVFLKNLKNQDENLYNKYSSLPNKEMEKKEVSFILIEVGKYLESFIGELFNIQKEVKELKKKHDDLGKIFECKKKFVQKKALRAEIGETPPTELQRELEDLFNQPFSEEAFAENVLQWLENKDEEKLEIATQYVAWAVQTEEGRARHECGVLFKIPKKTDYENLINVEKGHHDICVVKSPKIELREGFDLTDTGGTIEQATSQANYCLTCFSRDKDTCSMGSINDGIYDKNPLSVELTGCPLGVKISEMNALKSEGYSLAALAMVTVDDPMTPATGHRICNDCVKACIYQKQSPVDIPLVESQTLNDILELPWGFEIYSMLTRWNPLNIARPYPKDDTGKKVLVVGLGPSGYTLSHHLLNDGHTVVAIDGLKIEPSHLTSEGKSSPLLLGEGSGVRVFSIEEDIKYRNDIIERARELRKFQTKPENLLWKILRNRNIENCKFRRQHPIGKYFADFLCMEEKIIIELDGKHHVEQKEYDEERTAFLKQKGYNVIRFPNEEVLYDIDKVVNTIIDKIRALKNFKADSPHPFPLSRRERGTPTPIYDIKSLFKPLSKRVAGGFGGVAEYGITVRWNKNYLDLIRLLLERRSNFRMFGGVRFGSNITIKDAWNLGFDHIALCLGAGKPNLIPLQNNVSRGMRTASDFLMALQLTGAARKDSIANLQLKLPVFVIGGGLTAIDAATESLAYYPVQVEKFLTRYETLCDELGEEEVRKVWNKEELETADEFISHARAIREERALAEKEERHANILDLLNKWGGVRMVYRKKLMDAPCYRLNPDEIEKGLEEGIFIAPEYSPTGVKLDKYGHINEIEMIDGDGRSISIPARTVLIAAGTQPNTVTAMEHKGVFEFEGRYFKAVL